MRGLGKVGVVEDVEELEAKFEPGALPMGNGEGLGGGEVEVGIVRTEDLITRPLSEIGCGAVLICDRARSSTARGIVEDVGTATATRAYMRYKLLGV